MIAILFDENNNLTDIYHVKTIAFYEKNGTIHLIETKTAIIPETKDINTFRNGLKKLLGQLDSVKILVGTEISGLPFYFFDQNNIILCEAPSFSARLLEQIFEDYGEDGNTLLISHPEDEIEISEINISTSPVELDQEGNYFLDFVEVQKIRPDLSSKKAIIPFLNDTLFQTLTVVCSHVMPWLDVFLEQKNLIYTSKRENGRCILIISHKICT